MKSIRVRLRGTVEQKGFHSDVKDMKEWALSAGVRWKWAERRRLMETSWSASCVSRYRQRDQEGRWYLLTAVIELRSLTSPSRDKERRGSKVRPGRWELIAICLFAFFIDSRGSLSVLLGNGTIVRSTNNTVEGAIDEELLAVNRAADAKLTSFHWYCKINLVK